MLIVSQQLSYENGHVFIIIEKCMLVTYLLSSFQLVQIEISWLTQRLCRELLELLCY